MPHTDDDGGGDDGGITIGPIRDADTGEVLDEDPTDNEDQRSADDPLDNDGPEPGNDSGGGSSGGSSSSNSNDDTGNVVISNYPGEAGESKVVGSGDTMQEARTDAALNPDFDADPNTDVGRIEESIGRDPNPDTGAVVVNQEGEVQGRGTDILEARKSAAANPDFDADPGTPVDALETGKQADGTNTDKLIQLKQKTRKNKTNNNQKNQAQKTRFGENNILQQNTKQNIFKQTPTQTQTNNDNVPFPRPVRSAATDLDNFLTTQARDSFSEIRQQSEKARQANRQLDPTALNPVSLTAKGTAGLESGATETIQTLFTDQEFSVEDARNVEGERVKELQGTIGQVSAPVQKPLETANLIATSTPRVFTSTLAKDKEQKARDVDPSSVIGFGKQTAEQAKEDPTSFLLGGSLAFGGEKALQTSVKSIDAADTAQTVRQAGRKADPATGFGRTRRPGETTSTTPEIIKSKSGNIKDFFAGDISPEFKRTDEGKFRVQIDKEKIPEGSLRKPPKSTVIEGEDSIEIIGNEFVKQPQRVDGEVGIDTRTQEAVIKKPRNRRDVVSEKLQPLKDVAFTEFKGSTAGGRGLKLKTKSEDKTPDIDGDDLTGRRLDRQDRRQDVEPERLDFEDTRKRNVEENRQRQFNEPDTGQSFRQGLSLGVNQDLGVDQEPGLDVTPDQKNDVTQEEPLKPFEKEKPKQEGDNPRQPRQPKINTIFEKEPRIREQPRKQPEKPFEKENKRINLPDLGDDTNNKGIFSDLTVSQDSQAAPSVDAILTGSTTDKKVEDDKLFSGLETRELEEDFNFNLF